MVSFSNTDGDHCDSVADHSTLPSNRIQMDVKVPVQPSNFGALQKGALMGASTFMEQDKNNTYQCSCKTKSIPSPGTTSFRGCSLRVEKLNGHDNGNQESIVHLCISS